MDWSICASIAIQQKYTVPKMFEKVKQSLDYNVSVNSFMGYLQNTQEFFTPQQFSEIFESPNLLSEEKSHIFWDNKNTLGKINIPYNRAKFGDVLMQRIRNLIVSDHTSVYETNFQIPTNDLELFEWSKGFTNPEFLKNISPKDSDFSLGFFAFSDKDGKKIPFSDTDRYDWAFNWVKTIHEYSAQSEKLKDLYIFIPSNNRGDEFSRDGIHFHFMPIDDRRLNRVLQSVADNKGLIRGQYTHENLGALNSIDLVEVQLGQSAASHLIVNRAAVLQNGANRADYETEKERLTGQGLNRIMAQLQHINQDPTITTTPYTYKNIGWGTRII